MTGVQTCALPILPREDVLLRLFSALDAEPNYLFQDSFRPGGGVLSSGEQRLVQRYRALSAKGKAAVNTVLDAVEEKHAGSVAVLPAPRPARRIPLFASPAAAGYASPVLGEEYEMIDAGGEDAAQFAVRICGDSMEPQDRKSTRLNSSHRSLSRMPSSA